MAVQFLAFCRSVAPVGHRGFPCGARVRSAGVCSVVHQPSRAPVPVVAASSAPHNAQPTKTNMARCRSTKHQFALRSRNRSALNRNTKRTDPHPRPSNVMRRARKLRSCSALGSYAVAQARHRAAFRGIQSPRSAALSLPRARLGPSPFIKRHRSNRTAACHFIRPGARGELRGEEEREPEISAAPRPRDLDAPLTRPRPGRARPLGAPIQKPRRGFRK